MKTQNAKRKTQIFISKLNIQFGFTLIELLIVVSIMVTILSLGVAAYNSFANTQILDGAAKSLRANLRLSQAFAINGEIGTTSACYYDGTNPEVLPFNGYYFLLENNGTAYAFGQNCKPNNATNDPKTPPSPVSLPDGVTIQNISYNGTAAINPITVLFQSVRGAVFYHCVISSFPNPCYSNPVSGDITFQLSYGNVTRSLTITSDGKIQ